MKNDVLAQHGMNRRKFLASAAAAAAGLSIRNAAAQVSLPKPTAAQLAWQNYEVGMLFQLDLPVFAPGGWTDKCTTYDPNLFNPTQLDTDQWLESAKAAGAKYAVFTATHFNGFLQWQSDLYPYGLKQTKWRGGKADIVQMFVESCHKYGIAPGIYLSCHGNAYFGVSNFVVPAGKGSAEQARFARVNERMTEELVSRYGPLCEIWYDASLPAVQDGGPDVLPIIERWQKETVFYSNPQRNDHRWIGNEAGVAGDPCWATQTDLATAYKAHVHSNLPGMHDMDFHGDPDGSYWSPAMVDVPIRNHEWFWRPNDEHKVYTPEALVQMYYDSVGRNCNFLMGHVPDTRGLVPEKDFAAGEEFGKEIRRRFAKPVAETRGSGSMVELKLPRPMKIDHVVVMEEIAEGERVREFKLQALVPGNRWQTIFEGQSIGHKRIVKFAPMEVAKVQLVVTKEKARPLIRQLAAYMAG